MKLITAFAVFAWIGGTAQAADLFELKSASLTKSETSNLAELTLQFQDKEPVGGDCDLTVSRFEYVEAIRTVIVNLRPATFCAKDSYGKRQASVKWNLPDHLYSLSNLKVILNEKALTDLKIVKGQIIVKTKP